MSPEQIELESLRRKVAALEALQDKGAQEELVESRDRINLALASSRMATFDWDIVKNKRSWDHNVHQLLGTNPETFSGTAEEFLQIVHPDDRATVQEALSRAVDTIAPYEVEYRAVWPDSSIHHIAARGKVHRDSAGRAVRMTGICWDVTEERKREQELRRLNRTLKALRDSNLAMTRAAHESEYPGGRLQNRRPRLRPCHDVDRFRRGG